MIKYFTVCASNADQKSTVRPLAESQEERWRLRARLYSPAFQDAYVRFQQTGDRTCINVLAIGLLGRHLDNVSEEWIAEQGDKLNLKTGLDSDSITLAEVAFAVEELFDITMNNQDLAELETLHDLANFIERKRAAN